jgi:hypothetical protein
VRRKGSGRTWLVARLVLLPLSLTVATGCLAVAFDYTLVIRNDTDQSWYLRYIADPAKPNVSVDLIEPGANTYAASWIGAKDTQVELLNANCSVVGIFQSADETNYSVAGTDGISATVRPYNVFSDAGNPLGVSATRDCGGWVNL